MANLSDMFVGRLFEKREGVYPKAVNGRCRRLKRAIMAITGTAHLSMPMNPP